MSQATDLLSYWLQKARNRAPSMTRTSIQPSMAVGTAAWKPGITGYGWGINGTLLGNPANGLSFEAYVWFSDRGWQNGAPPNDCGQQFLSSQMDRESMQFLISGDDVELRLHSVTWNVDNNASTSAVDVTGQQLIFNIAGAGPNAPRALLVVSFADTGSFGWL